MRADARTLLRWLTALVLLVAAVFGPAAAAVRAPCAQATSASAVLVSAAPIDASSQEQAPAALSPSCNAPASVTLAVDVRAGAAASRECCAWGDVAAPSSALPPTPSRPPSLV